MQQKLIIFLHTHDSARPSWVVVDAELNISQSVRHGNADELEALSRDKEVIVIVPAESVTLISAKLPKMNRSRLAQALPYALEEQLIGDVETLHFVPGDTQPDGSLPVAIVSKEKMQEWLGLLQNWKLQVDVLMPLSLALPVEQNTWVIVLHEMAIVRIGDYLGFAGDLDNLNELINIALKSSEQIPQQIHIHNYSKNECINALKVSVEVREEFHEIERYEINLAINAGKFPYLNLMQGLFKTRKSKFPAMRKLLRTSIFLGVAWVVVLFLFPTVSYLMLERHVSSLDAQITEIYKRHFPQASSVVAPKLRMEEKLKTLTAQTSESRVLLLINYLDKDVTETPGVILKRLDFQNNQLTLELTAASSDDFSKFTEFLTRNGLNVKQQSANLVGVRVNAIIMVE